MKNLYRLRLIRRAAIRLMIQGDTWVSLPEDIEPVAVTVQPKGL